MEYKFLYRFIIEGVNIETDEFETLATLEQQRNIGIDYKLYKIIRTESYSHTATHKNISVTIYRKNYAKMNGNNIFYPGFEYVGMMFFDACDLYTHRGIIIRQNDVDFHQWGVFNWR